MLVLGRSAGKDNKIIIGEHIIITILGIYYEPKMVRIGIEAPKDMPIYRNEIYKLILKNKGLDNER